MILFVQKILYICILKYKNNYQHKIYRMMKHTVLTSQLEYGHLCCSWHCLPFR